MTSLPAGVFSGLSSLTNLQLQNNGLTSLPAGVFSGLSNLQQLLLHSNDLTSLPAGVFSGLSSLRILYLGGNALTSLPEGVFSGLSSLTTLRLTGNSVASFDVALSLEVDSANSTVRILAPLGAPEALAIPLSFSGGTVSGSSTPTVTIPAGATASPAVTVDVEAVVTVSFGTLPTLTPYSSSTNSGINGLNLVAGDAASFAPGICGRTEQVRAAIRAKLGNKACSLVTDLDLASISDELDLSDQSIASLQASDFSGLSSLTRLYLHTNALTSLPEGVFSGLSSLENLYLYHNALTSLPDDVFSGLSSLTTLSLHSNGLTSLPEGVFSGLSSLTVLTLYNNGLTSLPAGVFSGLSSLTTLNLTGNSGAPFDVALSLEIDSVASTVRILAPLGAPEALAIPLSISGGTVSGSSTATVTIPAGTTASPTVTVDFADAQGTATVSFGTLPALTPFSSNSGIDGLNLVAGDAVSFVPGICDRTAEVQTAISKELKDKACHLVTDTDLAGISGELDLSEQSIASLQASDFSGLSSLEGLYLNNNALASLPEGVFSGLSSLEGLYLNNNGLTSLPAGVFSGLSSLTRLDLNVTALTSLPAGVFSGLSSLTRLYLHSNALPSLPEGVFSGLSSLTQLTLSNNALTSLPDDVFSGLSSLTTLSLHSNGLTSLPEGVFSGLSSLTALTLNHNNALASLPAGVFSGLSSLTVLTLYNNGLTSLPEGVFSGLSSLTSLNLHSNALPSLPAGVFSGLSSLTSLQLTANSGAPFDVALSLEVDSVARTIRILAPLGAPEALAIPLSISGGTVAGSSAATVTIEAGATASPAVTVDFADDEGTATVSFGTLPALTPFSSNSGISGLTLVAGDAVSFAVDADSFLQNICDRTEQVRTAIRAKLGNKACTNVTDLDLAGISGTLSLNSQSITSLKAGDLSGLSSLQGLDVSGNQLTSLPDGLFSGLTSLSAGDLDFRSNKVPLVLPLVLDYQRISQSQGSLSVGLAIGAPVALSIPLRVAAGDASLSANTVTLAAGSTSSSSITVTRGASNADITLSFGTLPVLADTGLTLEQGASVILSVPVFPTASELDLTQSQNSALAPVQFEEASGLDAPLVHVLSTTTSTSGVSLPDGLPAGLSFDETSRILTGTPTTLGVYALTYTATDSDGDTATQTLDLTVVVDAAPSFGVSTVAQQDYEQFAAISDLELPAATGGNGTPVYSLTATTDDGTVDNDDNLPEGLDFDAGSRTLSGTPTAAGTYTMAYVVTDDDGASDSLPFQLVVDSVPTLVNAVIGSHTYVKDQAIDDVQLPLAEGGTDTVSYSLTATTDDGTVDSDDDLPAGLDFTASSRTLSGTPTAAGTYAMTYTATDTDSDSDTRTFELTVAAFFLTCDRTAQVRDALVARLKSDGTLDDSEGCAQVTDSMLTDLTGTLSLSNPSTKLTALVASDFAGLSSLEVLDLSDNSLTAAGLPANVFSSLTSLTGLNLGTNQLTSLPATLLTPLTSLTELQLNNNQLTTLPATLLSALTGLTELHLNNNQLATLPDTLLSALTDLTELHLNNNQLATLPDTLLTPLTSLTELHLNNNQLATLPATLLSTLTGLTELKLHNNQLAELPAGLFSELTSLIVGDLDFRDNKEALVLPLVLDYQRSSQSEGSLSVGLAIGAPVALTIPLQVAAGDATLSASTVTLAAGGVSSDAITVTRGAGNADITLSFGTLPVLTDTGLTLEQGASVTLSVPVFATVSLPDQTLLEGTALTSVQFEEASGLDTPLEHVLSTTTDDGTVDSADNLPMGLDFDADTRILSGTPTASGVYALTYTATDKDGDTATQTLNLTVEADTAPSFGASTVAQQDYKQFAAISDLVLPAATGGNGTPIYSLTATTDDGTVDSADDLPEGLDFDAGTRTLSGTPTAAGTYTMAYSATDDDGDSDNLPSFQLVVDSVPTLANAVIGSHTYVKDQTIDDVQLPLAEGGTDTVSYSLTATTLDGTVDSADDLPEGLDFAASSRTLSGTPTAAGTYAMTYTATDTDSDSDTRTFELTVAAFVPVCDRTAQVRDALVARLKSDGTLGGTDGCAQVTDGMLSGLTGTLDVSNPSPKLTALVASDFSGLSSLEMLDLSDNSLTASGLPTNVFSALTSLTGLNLGTNQLASLPATLLTPLTSLTELQLNNNQLASLPATLLSTLTKLTELHLNNNQLASLPATLLSTLTSLSELKLHNNQLSELPAGLFSGLTSLSEGDLDFRDNKTALVLPLVLDYQRSSQSEGSLSVGLAIGAPVALTIPLQVAAGTATLSASTVTLAAGGTSSSSITVTRGAGNADITLSFGTLPVLTDTGLTLGQGASVMLSVPVFATASLPDQTLLEGTALTPVQFEEASGLDTPLVHVLSTTTDDGTVDSADNLPVGLDFNASTRILSGTPTASGVYALTYTATDSDGDTATQTLNLTVEADTAPSFGASTVAQQDYKQFAAISDLVLPAATGGNGTPVYSLTATTERRHCGQRRRPAGGSGL